MPTLTIPLPLPAPGAQIAGGTYAGITTGLDGAPYALILLADKPSEDLAWKAAMSWAAGLQASLPTRPEGALLYALLKDQFEPTWHWLSEEFAGSYAWGQYFGNGDQYDSHKSYEGRARAVRRLPLESFIPSLEVAE